MNSEEFITACIAYYSLISSMLMMAKEPSETTVIAAYLALTNTEDCFRKWECSYVAYQQHDMYDEIVKYMTAAECVLDTVKKHIR